MPRNLDMTALRAFATVVEAGGVTRAAALLHLTQSAVSMQLKRLEEALDVRLLDRTPRGVRLTSDGERALAAARRMIELNDGLIEALRDAEPEGEIRLGVPHDIVPKRIPEVLRAFAADYPRVRVDLISSVTTTLHRMFEDGACDVILATEDAPRPDAETLVRLPLVWVGAEEGEAWARRPLRMAFEKDCVFRHAAIAALERADIPWELALTADSSRAVDATVSADLACHVVIDGFDTGDLRPVPHRGTLPEIGEVAIALYTAPSDRDPARDRLLELIRASYGTLRPAQDGAARPLALVSR